jgi:FkbM family methyltransferase
MAADSIARRLVKHVSAPLLSERVYSILQAAAKAWDIRTGSWYEPELELIPYAVRTGETAVDIGGNYGLYAYHLSRAVGPSGRVYSFEPVPLACAAFGLVTKILRLRNVVLIPKACGETQGRATLIVPIADSGTISAGLTHLDARNNDRDGKAIHFKFSRTQHITCDMVRVDDIMADAADVTFVKCDIEGAELVALRGATKIIDRFRPSIVCEINPWFLEGFGIKLDELLNFFGERGYQLYWYDDRQRRLVPKQPAQVVEDNYFFIHPERRERFSVLLENKRV